MTETAGDSAAAEAPAEGIADYSVSLYRAPEEIGDDEIRPLLHIERLHQFAVELTTSCNLACVYCHFAPLDRRGNNATHDLVDRIVDFAGSFPIDIITLSGDAEITMYKGWEQVALRLLKAGCRLRSISNFSNGIFSPAEVEAFSYFSEILVSLDTPDAALLKKTRYRADLRTMTYNLQQIRAKCLEDGRPQPRLVCNAVIHDKNFGHIDRLAAFAIANGFNALSLQRFVALEEVKGGKNDFWDNPNALQLFPLDHLDDLTLLRGMQALQRAMTMSESRIEFGLHPALSQDIERLLARLGVDEDDAQATADDGGLPQQGRTTLADGRVALADGRIVTKACMMPWDYMHIMWNGDVPPCCIVKDEFVANISDRPIAEVINSDEMKAYREGLLTGRMQPLCVDCTYVPETDTASLRASVRGYLERLGQYVGAATY